MCLYSASPSGKKSGMLQVHQTCLQVRCGSHGIVLNLSATILDTILNISNSERCISCMISVAQESVKSAFYMRIPGVCCSQGKFSYILCNKLPFWQPFCLNYYFIFIFLLWAKCLQLDSNVIANNLRKKMGLRHFSIPHNFFTNNWPPSWTPSWIYRNAQWCQSGITRIFQGQYMHY